MWPGVLSTTLAFHCQPPVKGEGQYLVPSHLAGIWYQSPEQDRALQPFFPPPALPRALSVSSVSTRPRPCQPPASPASSPFPPFPNPHRSPNRRRKVRSGLWVTLRLDCKPLLSAPLWDRMGDKHVAQGVSQRLPSDAHSSGRS